MEKKAEVEAQISHCSLCSWIVHRDLLELESKLGEGLIGCMIRRTPALSGIISYLLLAGIQQQYDMEANLFYIHTAHG